MTVKPDLSVKIGKLNLKNPIITASGTFGYADEYEEYVNLQKLGAIVTKGITLKPREGNPQPRIREVRSGMINWIGLENVGIDAFVENKLPILLEKKINFIVNIAGSSIDDYVELAKICEINSIKAIELNASCPNVKNGCLEFGKSPEMIEKLVSSVREVYSGTLIIKLGANVSYPVQMAQTVEKSGADAISAINTLKGMDVKAQIRNGKITTSIINGGLSGPCIKPVALNFINEIRNSVSIPIIGMGGIACIEDVIDFVVVGSSAIQVGTANFTHPGISEKLVDDLENLLIEQGIKSFSELTGEQLCK